jgi:K+-transporting ATPase KdpF subunit
LRRRRSSLDWPVVMWFSATKSRTDMENIIAGIISVALCIYLLVAMIRPEKF